MRYCKKTQKRTLYLVVCRIMINFATKKREYNEEPPPQLYEVTEQNDDVTDGIVGGRLLRIGLWNMK